MLRDGPADVLQRRFIVQLDPTHPESLASRLQDAVEEELLNRNVARLVQLRVTDDCKVRSFTVPRRSGSSHTAEKHRLYALWAVALAMGLRRGEALGLRLADVDLEQGRLTIRRALHRVDGHLELTT